MGTFKTFEDIEAWQKARELVNKISQITESGLFSKDFGLRDQIRRASVSVMANIAEGFERDGRKEFIQFLSMAKGSIGEVRSHLYVALDREYIDSSTFHELHAKAKDVARRIAGLMAYLSRSAVSGAKFRKPETRNLKQETRIVA